jgi:ABC-type transport system involved in multi-copper enzyme maturation permease subunit
MSSWSFYLVCFGLGLLQMLAAVPWFYLLFGRARPEYSRGPRVGPRPSIFTHPLFIWVTSAVGIAAGVPFLIAAGPRQGFAYWGYIYAGLLQVQLTFDLIILFMGAMLFVWPKGGAVAQAAFREGVRQPMFWLIVLFAFLALSLAPILPYFTFGEDYIMTKELGYDTIMLATVIFGVLAATLFVTDEIEGRTAITLMSKPVSRRQFLLGKFVGIMFASVLMFGILGFYFQDVLLFKHWFDKDDPTPVPEWVTSTLTSYALPTDAFSFLEGAGMWTQHMLDTLPGLVLSFCQVMVLVAFAVSFATRVPMVLNLTGILAVYFLAHLSPVLVQIGASAQAHHDETITSQVFASTVLNFVAQVFDTLLPALEFFRVSPRLVGDAPPEPGTYLLYLGSVLFYGILYTAIVLLFGLILFEDRDLA